MVSLVQVEDVLQRVVPAEVACAVVEVPDALRGSKIVAVTTGPVDERAVMRQMGEAIARIALPRQFVTVTDLPRMPSGKIDYRTLTDTVQDIVQKA